MKKDFLNLRRSRWLLLSLFALFVGVSPAGAETLTTNLSTLPDGWSVVGATHGSDRARSGKAVYTSAKNAAANYLLTEELEGSIEFYWRSYGTSGSYPNGQVILYKYDGSVGDQIAATTTMKSSTWTSATLSLGDYKGQVAIGLYSACIDDITYTQMEDVSGPALVVKDGSKVTSPYAYNFGLATAGTTHEFKLTNPGTAAVEGLTVSETGSFGATLSATTIAAKGEATLTITMPAATGNSTITISSTTDGIEDFVINASGTVKDPNKFFIDFTDAPLPVTWTMDAGWSITSGYAHAGYTASSIRSGQIVAEDGEQIIFKHKGSSSYSSGVLKVYWATTGNGDDADWDEGTTIATTYNVWNTAIVSIPKEAKYIRIYGQYVDIDDFYGLSAPTGALFAINTDGTTQDFGFVAKNATAEKTFTVTNSGNAALNVSFAATGNFAVTAPAPIRKFKLTDNFGWGNGYVYAWDGEGNALLGEWPGTACVTTTNGYDETQFVVTVPNNAAGVIVNNGNGAQTVDITNFTQGYWMDGSTDGSGHYKVEGWSGDGATEEIPAVLTVAAGESADFTVTMNTATPGSKSGNVTLSFDALNATSFTIPASGYVADPDKIYADFNDNQLPTGWSDNTGWTFSDGKAVAGYDTQMTLPALTVAEGEKLAISVMGTSSSKELYYYTSTDGGTSWSAKSTNLASSISTSAYSVVYIEGLAAGNYKLKLQGYQVKIDAINGFVLNANAPELTVDPTTAADFGTKIKAQPAAKTYTITNSGTGTLTGTITSSDTDKFTVSQSSFSLGAGENMTFDVNLVFDENYGEKTATITIHPTNDGLDDVVINATATTADPNVWEEDFESGSIPTSWTNNGWTINRKWSEDSSVKHAYSGSSNDNTLTTPRLQAAKDAVLQFEVLDAEANYPLTIKYATSRDGEFVDYATVTESGTATFVAPLEGTNYYYIQFSGRYIYLDDFVGFKEAPLAHDATISAQNIPATGTQYVEYTATVTVKEMAGKEEELTAKFFIGAEQFGTDVVETVEANGTKTFTVTFTPNAAVSGDAHFTVTNGDINLTSDNVAVNISEALVLDEAVDNSALITDGTKPAVVVKYTKDAGKWGTIALPFQTTPSELSTLYGGAEVKAFEFKANNAGVLNFRSAETLVAGYPYVIYSEGAMGGDVKFFGKTLTSAKADAYGEVTFQAVYAPKTYTAGDSWYGVTPDGEIRPAGEGASIGALRGYLQATAGARLVISIEDVATGITTVLSPKEFEAEGVYNLQGQKVQQAKKGLYIVNGRKVVVR